MVVWCLHLVCLACAVWGTMSLTSHHGFYLAPLFLGGAASILGLLVENRLLPFGLWLAMFALAVPVLMGFGMLLWVFGALIH